MSSTVTATGKTTPPGGPNGLSGKTAARRDSRPDDQLVTACLRGEQDAWETLLERYGRLIYSIPLRYGLPAEEAADVYQTVCVTLLEKLEGLRDSTRLSSWLITVTARECWAVARRRRQVLSGPTSGDEQTLEEVDGDPLPEEVALQWEEQHTIRMALARLPERCQRLLWYLFYDRSCPSYVEIANRLGIPTSSIGPTRARCLEKLRGILERSDD